ncbi:MAG: DUF3422 family protein [Labrenzia sp.]
MVTTQDHGLAGFLGHPGARAVMRERHARPPLPVDFPSHCQHIVFRRCDTSPEFCKEGWRKIFDRHGFDSFEEHAESVFAESAELSIKWEHHTEFVALTIVRRTTQSVSIEEYDPRDFTTEPVFLSLLLGIEDAEKAGCSNQELFEWPKQAVVRKSKVLTGTTTIVSDFKFDRFGNIRFLITTEQMDRHRLGRLVQRLIEIETYGAFVLLSWETVAEVATRLEAVDSELKLLVGAISENGSLSDKDILGKLAHLAALHEANIADSNFRLNASLAYFDIVQERLSELNEERIEGNQRFSNFIKRRSVPAARTYEHLLSRQEKVSQRLSRATQLLRSRIDVELAEQNQLQLASMNARAEAQYKLQKTVEGLSAIAISYYALGILSYMASSFSDEFDSWPLKEMIGYLAPALIIGVWFALRRLK